MITALIIIGLWVGIPALIFLRIGYVRSQPARAGGVLLLDQPLPGGDEYIIYDSPNPDALRAASAARLNIPAHIVHPESSIFGSVVLPRCSTQNGAVQCAETRRDTAGFCRGVGE